MRPLLCLVVALVAACHDDAPAVTPVDAGTVTECRAGDAPKPCGKGGACHQACTDGAWGACEAESGPVDVRTDLANCGECGNACPVPANAGARCVAGRCARGPCGPGFFDLDGDRTPGCEARCDGRHCTLGDGSTVDLASPPLPEIGLVGSALATGSSYGSFVQTGPGHTNVAILGESTPASPGTIEQKGAAHRNVAGFTAVQPRESAPETP